jgi:CheY-like chemotaxis protein
MACILVVDDDLPTCGMLSLVLENEGYQVAVCTQGLRSYPLVHELQPDLVVLDLRLPDLSGQEILALLKGDQQTKYIPILVCSASESV